MFQRVSAKLKPITKHIAVILSRDSNNIKNLVEESIYQLMSNEKVVTRILRNTNCYILCVIYIEFVGRRRCSN